MNYFQKIIQIIKIKLIVTFCNKQRRHRDCIVLSSFNHDYKDNARYLFEHLIAKGYNAYYIVRPNKIVDKNRLSCSKNRVISLGSSDYFSAISQCKYAYFTHSERDIGWHVPKRATLVNLWHGSPMKKMGYDSPQDRAWLNKYKWLRKKTPYERWHFILVASDFFKDAFKSALHYPDEKILVCGLPRNSKLTESDKYLGKESGTRRILYVPTYRTVKSVIPNICRELKNKFSRIPDTLLYIRLHPFDKALLDERFFDSKTIDAGKIVDIYDELSGFDILITDYSSIAFDFSVTNKPVHLFCPDLDEYTKDRGGLYFPPESLPFHFSRSAEELVRKIDLPAAFQPEQFSEPASLLLLENLLLKKRALDENLED